MAGMGNSQTINGQSYEMFTPQWYAAQDANKVHQAGVSGTAGGTGEANYLDALSPSLQGLYRSMGLSSGTGTSGTSSTSTPSTVNYGGTGSTSTAMPSAVNYSGFGGAPVSSKGLTSDAISTSPTQTIAPLDLSKADTAAFATAKDQANNTCVQERHIILKPLIEHARYELGWSFDTIAAALQLGHPQVAAMLK